MAREERQITKIIAASLLGDASIQKTNAHKNARFTLTLVDPHKDHLDYIAAYIEQVTPVSFYRNESDRNGRKPYTQLYSRFHPFFLPFRERMYGTGRKSVDKHYLTLLDWEFLAIWHMQDGYLNIQRNQIVLATQSFSYPENHYLRIALKETLDLDFTVRSYRQNKHLLHRLELTQKQTQLYCENLKPYVQPSFEYKINCRTIRPVKKTGDDIVSSAHNDNVQV